MIKFIYFSTHLKTGLRTVALKRSRVKNFLVMRAFSFRFKRSLLNSSHRVGKQ